MAGHFCDDLIRSYCFHSTCFLQRCIYCFISLFVHFFIHPHSTACVFLLLSFPTSSSSSPCPLHPSQCLFSSKLALFAPFTSSSMFFLAFPFLSFIIPFFLSPLPPLFCPLAMAFIDTTLCHQSHSLVNLFCFSITKFDKHTLSFSLVFFCPQIDFKNTSSLFTRLLWSHDDGEAIS